VLESILTGMNPQYRMNLNMEEKADEHE